MRAPFGTDSTDFYPDDDVGIAESERGKIGSFEKCASSGRSKAAVFGTCLEDLMGVTKNVVPFVLSRLCQYIEKYGLLEQSLFVEGEEKAIVQRLRSEFVEKGDAPLEKIGNVASASKLLLLFFEELPEPLLPHSAQSDLINKMKDLSLESCEGVRELKEGLGKLPSPAYHVLKYLSRFLMTVSCYQEYNGMSSEHLALLFTPFIFRSSTSCPDVVSKLREIFACLVCDYHAIFDDSDVLDAKSDSSLAAKLARHIPSPSSVVPVMSLSPLSVFIPSPDERDASDNKSKDGVPVLLIEGEPDLLSTDSGICSMSPVKPAATRKRKERRYSGEELAQQRSSSEERPLSSLSNREKVEPMRRCSSHEEVSEDAKNVLSAPLDIPKADRKLQLKNSLLSPVDTYLANTVEVINESNHSPHPPHAKRREIEMNSELYNNEHGSYKSPNHSRHGNGKHRHRDALHQAKANQNPVAELDREEACRTEAMEEDETDQSGGEKEPIGLRKSATFPVPGSQKEEGGALPMSWSMLFEDSEPVRAAHPISWSSDSQHDGDDAMLSPSVHRLRSTNFYEAPLSPSAFKTYLSHRSSHLDPSVPPSPPGQQGDFAKKQVEENNVLDSIKLLQNSISDIKRKIRKFDEKFEVEFGYKPSHAEKSIHRETKKWLADLKKKRKELRSLKAEAHLDHVSRANGWQASKLGHILEDTTNHGVRDVHAEKHATSFNDCFGNVLMLINSKRIVDDRPNDVEEMSENEKKEEKKDIQMALLTFEKHHGRGTKEERALTRPLYDRYRTVKKQLKMKKLAFPRLPPIWEDQTMDFRQEETQEVAESEIGESSKDEFSLETYPEDFKATHSSTFMTMKYDNCNLHEMQYSEMVLQVTKLRAEKKRLNRIIRDFERDIVKNRDRKPTREEKAPHKSLYNEYKHVRARCQLLDALIAKREEHQLM